MKYYELESLYCENINQNDLIDILNSSNDILEYYGILHDKDIKEDTGEIKKPHFHLYIAFEDYGRDTIQKVRDYFKPLTSRINSVKSPKKAIQYLIHYNDKNKFQYDIEDIFTNNKDKLLKQFEEKEKSLNDILEIFYNLVFHFEILEDIDIINFFKSYNMLNYCVCHYKSLKDFVDGIHSSYECKTTLKESEEFNKC